nr:hypothetical protein [Tanacetum cinerariifolium]
PPRVAAQSGELRLLTAACLAGLVQLQKLEAAAHFRAGQRQVGS